MRQLKTQERLKQEEKKHIKLFDEAKNLAEKRHEQLHKNRVSLLTVFMIQYL
jgi:hypothetical protein